MNAVIQRRLFLFALSFVILGGISFWFYATYVPPQVAYQKFGMMLENQMTPGGKEYSDKEWKEILGTDGLL